MLDRMRSRAGSYRLGVDIGGTFTDIVLLGPGGDLFSKKILSTPDDYSRAIEEGVGDLLREVGIGSDRVSEFAHGTTVATNTIIERKGVKVALVTTKGFRDVLELGRYRSPHLYDMGWRKPEPIVERRLRLEIAERIDGHGDAIESLTEDEFDQLAERIRTANVRSVAVCLINAYLNPANEIAVVDALAKRLPDTLVSASSQVQPQISEYERTSTTVVNAYIRPIVSHYVQSLERRLKNLGISVPLMIMQSSGGTLPGDLAAANPVFIIESGPAAGVVGAQRLGSHVNLGDLLVLDMGGTTAKASIIEGGSFAVTNETEVGGGASLGHRLVKGAGYVVQVPTIDIAEVGAGGGSIALVDDAGGLVVGPRSAGANPGPICYQRGGTQPTVTDANLFLGYLNPEALVGGDLSLDFKAAEAALTELGQRIGLSTVDIAYGIHVIANANMMRALKGVSSERGRDPSHYSLLAIGGNGGVHSGSLAEALRITKIVVPPVAGLFSALGLLFADLEHHLSATYYRVLSQATLDDLNNEIGPLAERAKKLLQSEGFGTEAARKIQSLVEVKYVGQTSALTIPVGHWPVTMPEFLSISADFQAMHDRVYGYRSENEEVQIVAVKVIGTGVSDVPRMPDRISRDREKKTARTSRRAYFGADLGWQDTPLRSRIMLSETPIKGPLIIEEYDTTTVVRPGWSVRKDHWNNIIIERIAAS